MFSFPVLLTIYAGFMHAFEADHLLAVSSLVSQRSTTRLSLKDGIFWGLGHASTIFCMGTLMIVLKEQIPVQYFQFFEAGVGFMLITLAIYRMAKFYRTKKILIHVHPHQHNGEIHKRQHKHIGTEDKYLATHSIAYGVGLIHGLAGSGALVILIMSKMKGALDGLAYMLIFAICCIGGMVLASGLFSIPFSKKIMKGKSLQSFLIIISSLLCLLYGGKVIYENLLV